MGEHIDNRKGKGKKKFNEGADFSARQNRVTFKNYLRQIEEELIEEELIEDELEELDNPVEDDDENPADK